MGKVAEWQYLAYWCIFLMIQNNKSVWRQVFLKPWLYSSVLCFTYKGCGLYNVSFYGSFNVAYWELCFPFILCQDIFWEVTGFKRSITVGRGVKIVLFTDVLCLKTGLKTKEALIHMCICVGFKAHAAFWQRCQRSVSLSSTVWHSGSSLAKLFYPR